MLTLTGSAPDQQPVPVRPHSVSVFLSRTLAFHWFWLNSHGSNFVLTSSFSDHFTSCSFHFLSGFCQSFLRSLQKGKSPHFILHSLHFAHALQDLSSDLYLIVAPNGATEVTQRMSCEDQSACLVAGDHEAQARQGEAQDHGVARPALSHGEVLGPSSNTGGLQTTDPVIATWTGAWPAMQCLQQPQSACAAVRGVTSHQSHD